MGAACSTKRTAVITPKLGRTKSCEMTPGV
jgi:hypothetical protein